MPQFEGSSKGEKESPTEKRVKHSGREGKGRNRSSRKERASLRTNGEQLIQRKSPQDSNAKGEALGGGEERRELTGGARGGMKRNQEKEGVGFK